MNPIKAPVTAGTTFWKGLALVASLVITLTTLTTCASSSSVPSPATIQATTVNLDGITVITGQTVYVPIYSHIYTWEQNRTMNLTATLSVRNTDLSHPLIVTLVDYYDTQGTLVRHYLEQPIELKPLAAQPFVVNQEDVQGGAGASFIVEWVAQEQVSAPVIEAIMINAGGNQGISFVSPGRVVKTLEPASRN